MTEAPSWESRLQRYRKPVYIVFLSLSLLLAYAVSCKNQFVNWDDDRIIYNCAEVKQFTWENIRHVFTDTRTPAGGMYLPVRTLTHIFEWRVWGDHPRYFFIVNVLLFLANAILLFRLLIRLGVPDGGVMIGVLLWALHPLRVESVTWLSARKDVLSLFFFQLSFLMFIEFSENPKRRRVLMYAGSLGLFGLAVLSKLTVAVLPLLMGAYLVFIREPRESEGFPDYRRLYVRLTTLFPFILAVLFVYHISVGYGESRGYLKGALGSDGWTSFLTALKIHMAYLVQTVWPLELSNYYVVPAATGLFENAPRAAFNAGAEATVAWLQWPPILGLSLFLAVAGALSWGTYRFLQTGKSGVPLLFGYWYVIAFLPVSNLVPTYIRMADRYTLIPQIGLFGLCGWLLYHLYIRSRLIWLKNASLAVLGLVVFGLYIGSVQRNKVWKNSTALWQDCLKRNATWHRAHYFLGLAQFKERSYSEAQRSFAESLHLNPNYYWSLKFHGDTSEFFSRSASQLSSYAAAVSVDPVRGKKLRGRIPTLAKGLLLQRPHQRRTFKKRLVDARNRRQKVFSKNSELRLVLSNPRAEPEWWSVFWMDASGKVCHWEARCLEGSSDHVFRLESKQATQLSTTPCVQIASLGGSYARLDFKMGPAAVADPSSHPLATPLKGKRPGKAGPLPFFDASKLNVKAFTPASPLDIHLDLTHPQTGRVDVIMAFRQISESDPLFQPMAGVGACTYEQVAFFDGSGKALPFDRVGLLYRVQQSKPGPLFVRFTARPGGIGRHGHQGWVDGRFASMDGSIFLMYSKVKELNDIRLRFQIPKGWRTVTAHRKNGDWYHPDGFGSAYRSKALVKTVMAFGPFEETARAFGNTQVKVHVFADWAADHKRTLIDKSFRMYRYFHSYFRFDPGGPFVICWTPSSPKGLRVWGAVWSNGMCYEMERDRLRNWELFAHRIAHPMNEYQPTGMLVRDREDHWFVEGWASYIETVATRVTGISTDDSRWNFLYQRYLKALRDHPEKDLPLSREPEAKADQVEFIHYVKAPLVMKMLDQHLRVHAGTNLEVFMALMYKRYGSFKKPFPFREELERYGGPGIRDFWRVMVRSKGHVIPVWPGYLSQLKKDTQTWESIGTVSSIKIPSKYFWYLAKTGLADRFHDLVGFVEEEQQRRAQLEARHTSLFPKVLSERI